NLNIKSAFWHTISDALSSIGVIAGGIIILLTNFYLADPIIGFIIGILILRGAFLLVKDSVNILFEGTPKDLNFDEITAAIKNIKGIKDVHDLHIWAITSGYRALSAHILVEDVAVSVCGQISGSAKNILSDRFNITHTTLEFECGNCGNEAACGMPR
ncbi:MAG: cation diffusion facilitator family transporter, partial [Candidatus Margulisiibacteriota bacterium]